MITRTYLVRLLTRISISGLGLALFAMHIAGAPRLELIDRVENYLYDVRIRLTMPGTVDERIVIIDIDEASQLELGQWPWPRNTLAAIVDQLFDDYGIAVLGLDVLFAEAEETSAERVIAELASSSPGEITYLTRIAQPDIAVITNVYPAHLSGLGDLETIVQKSLRKRPENRYQSAADLAADIGRFLEHQPIVARPATALYQLSRFARRHRPLFCRM